MSIDSRLTVWILRFAVALQCAGYAWLVGGVGESPLLGWLWEPRDVGGLALGETAAMWIARLVAGLLTVAAVSILLRPSRLLLACVVLFQAVYTYAQWQTYSGFPLDVGWMGTGPLRRVAESLVPLFPFAAGAARIAAPLVLLLACGARPRQPARRALGPVSEWLARFALAMTFAAHGLESLHRPGPFLDMLIVASEKLLGARLPQTVAEGLLVGIGIADLTVAVLVVVARWRAVAWYMAAWGFVTAAARLIVLPADTGWYEFAVRSSHWALPLVLALTWRAAQTRDNGGESSSTVSGT